jgi:hypothetical protein
MALTYSNQANKDGLTQSPRNYRMVRIIKKYKKVINTVEQE